MNEQVAISFVTAVLTVVGLVLFGRWFAGMGLGAPFLPSRKRDIADAFALVPIGSDDTVIDLGAGDGRVLAACAERGARVVGYEISPFLAFIARRRLKKFGDRARVFRSDLRKADLSEATVLFVFGIGDLMPKIAQMIHETGRPGLRIISVAFALPGFEPVGQKGIIRVYRKP